jgi:hypothetical protein
MRVRGCLGESQAEDGRSHRGSCSTVPDPTKSDKEKLSIECQNEIAALHKATVDRTHLGAPELSDEVRVINLKTDRLTHDLLIQSGLWGMPPIEICHLRIHPQNGHLEIDAYAFMGRAAAMVGLDRHTA